MGIFSIFGAIISAYGGPAAVAVLAAQSISRAIPATKGGFLGTVKKVTAVIGGYNPATLNQVIQVVKQNVDTLRPVQGNPPVNLDKAASVGQTS